jgi:hypothetical protein
LAFWFWIDLVATVPIDLILTWTRGGHGNGTSLNKLIRLLRGFKMMRAMKMSRIIHRAMKQIRYKNRLFLTTFFAYLVTFFRFFDDVFLRMNAALVRLVKILCALCLMWHCLGCFYWMVAAMDSRDSPWKPRPELLEAPFSAQYCAVSRISGFSAIFHPFFVRRFFGRSMRPCRSGQIFLPKPFWNAPIRSSQSAAGSSRMRLWSDL